MKTAAWKAASIAAALAVIAVSVPAFAQAPAAAAVTKAHGKITAVSATSITVEPKNGTPSTFTINASTEIKIDKKPATADDLKVGQRAAIKSDDGTVATHIAVNTHPGKHKKPAPAATTPAAPVAPAAQ